MRIEESRDRHTKVRYDPNLSLPWPHKNLFKQIERFCVQFEKFKMFIEHNSVTNKSLKEMAPYLIPSMLQIRPVNKPSGAINELQIVSWTLARAYVSFNKFLKGINVAPVSHDNVSFWKQKKFPKHGVSTIQTDYCDTWTESKKQVNGREEINAPYVKEWLQQNGRYWRE